MISEYSADLGISHCAPVALMGNQRKKKILHTFFITLSYPRPTLPKIVLNYLQILPSNVCVQQFWSKKKKLLCAIWTIFIAAILTRFEKQRASAFCKEGA